MTSNSIPENKLKQYFPIIRTKNELLTIINNDPHLSSLYHSWNNERQNELIDFCTGVKGIKILYDSFFKEILNPEYHPERLADLISTILGQTVKIIQVLPNDSTRIADETSLLITDIVVELEDGSIANVEMQKIGYLFPGQRSACYSSDLLLRQYKRVKNKNSQKFSYKDIKNVYTIIIMEQGSKEFHKFPNTYLHKFSQKSDTGLTLELLQKFHFLPLDMWKKTIQTNGIKIKSNERLKVWLTFLCADDPAHIIWIIEHYPEFKEMYGDLYTMCQNVEEVMNMFSKELQELDRNTVLLMIDEMQNEIDNKKQTIAKMDSVISEKDNVISEKDNVISEKDNALILANKHAILAIIQDNYEDGKSKEQIYARIQKHYPMNLNQFEEYYAVALKTD